MKHRLETMAILLGAPIAALSTGGCSLATDLDSFESVDGGATGDAGVECSAESEVRRDLVLELDEFSPHVDEPMEFRVVTDDSPPLLRALALVNPVDAAMFTVEMPGAIPAGSHRLEFWADHDETPGYSPPEDGESFFDADHSWSIEPCAPITRFKHSGDFKIIEDPVGIGSDAQIAFTGMPADLQRFELRVINEDTGATVGMYRNPVLNSTDFTVVIPDIIDTGLTYTVAFYSDTNDNDAYDAPPTDEAWEITGITGGVDETFDYDPDATTDIGF
ncbi:MAG: hypothetical protein ACOCXM_07165 [Myxococcota bacterium]